MGNILSTAELDKYVHQEYKKLKKKAVISLIYRRLSTKFEVCTCTSLDGQYCYSDGSQYHYYIMERGCVIEEVVTKNLCKITYQAIEKDISEMALLYELMHRRKAQDTRRLAFVKEAELFYEIGIQYYEYHKDKIEGILKENPYEDS